MARQLVQEYLKRGAESDLDQFALSPREHLILRLIGKGFSSKEISEQLVINTSTVYTHQINIMVKLNLNSRHELVRYARKRGFIKNG